MSRIQTTIRNVQRPGGITSVLGGVGGRVSTALGNVIRGDKGGYNTDTGNLYNLFLRNILASTNSLSLKPLWVCFVDELPVHPDINAMDKNTGEKHKFLNTGEGFDVNKPIENLDMSTAGDANGAKAALLCQECKVPGEGYDVSKPRSDNVGGFLSPGVGSSRQNLSTLKTAYLETNKSLTDGILRPWLIDASYRSLKYTTRTTMTMIKFARTGPGRPLAPVKVIKFFGCCPVKIDDESYVYKDQAVIIRQVEWHYDSYTMDFTGANFEGKAVSRDKETLVSQLLDDFLGEKKQGKTRIGSFIDGTTNEARGFVANKLTSFITSNVESFGRSLENMIGIRSDLPSTSNGKINANDTPSSIVKQDNVRPNALDTPSISIKQDDVNVAPYDLLGNDTSGDKKGVVKVVEVVINENDTPNNT